LTIQTYGPSLPTTTTTTPGATTTTVVGSGAGGATTTTVRRITGGTLANTGSPLALVWFQVFIALAIVQLGVWLWAVSSRRRR
jgi:hypothetical protein